MLRELSKVLSLRVLICLECLLFQGRLEIEDPKLSADTTNGQIDDLSEKKEKILPKGFFCTRIRSRSVTLQQLQYN